MWVKDAPDLTMLELQVGAQSFNVTGKLLALALAVVEAPDL